MKSYTEPMSLPSQSGFDVKFTKTDVSSYESVENAVNATVEAYGRLDVVVNCAGIVGRKELLLYPQGITFCTGPTNVKIADVKVEDFDKVYGVSLKF